MSLQATSALLLFVIVSVLVGSTLAGAGGWRALASRFPGTSTPSPQSARFRFASMRTAGGPVGSASYQSCVTIGVGEQGISLALWAPLGLFHPPILLPWDAVEQCQTVEAYGNRITKLAVRGGETLTLYGRPAAEIALVAEAQGVPTRPLGPEFPAD